MFDILYPLPSLQDTQTLAQKIVQCLQPCDVVLLKGDLGAGKTTLAKKIITLLNPEITSIPSPTFTLSQTYDTPKGDVWHYDLYRLKSSEEVLELGIDEAFASGICLIEWPERLGNLRLPSALLKINLVIMGPDDQRQAELTLSESWQQRWPA
ncbi:MAG: tRNA (adenosine(37)-N6)-threonylcarbamoyltransferase complex ATPase subunit type 1 TsaE [Janthinobacterium lividum]